MFLLTQMQLYGLSRPYVLIFMTTKIQTSWHHRCTVGSVWIIIKNKKFFNQHFVSNCKKKHISAISSGFTSQATNKIIYIQINFEDVNNIVYVKTSISLSAHFSNCSYLTFFSLNYCIVQFNLFKSVNLQFEALLCWKQIITEYTLNPLTKFHVIVLKC